MTNESTVERLIEFKSSIQNSLKENPIHLHTKHVNELNLIKDGKNTAIFIGENQISEKSIKKIADRFKIKPEFFQLGKEIGENEIEDITNKLKTLKNEAILCELPENSKIITDIRFEYPENKRKDTSNLEIISNLDKIINHVKKSDTYFGINRLQFTPKNSVNIELLTEENIEVLKDDPWKVGIQTDFSKTHFNMNPFLLRRICTNGMMAAEYGFQSNISQMKWNNEKIEEVIKNNFLNPQDEMKNAIMHNVNLLKNSNISIAELNRTKNTFLNKVEDEQQALNLIKQYFNDENLYKYYGNIEDKSDVYLKTADTGINAYDHFNMITWITSHLNESNLSENDQFAVNIRASEILFNANNLDLNQIAPKINFN